MNQENGRTVQKPVSFTGKEAANPSSDELLLNIVDSFETNDGAKNGTDEGIDLNKTPQQRPPKRKKHRPKVIIEGNAKRTKTSHMPEKPNGVVGNPSGKRKYIRKNALKETDVAPQEEDARETGAAKEYNAMKSSRRALNFDLEEVATEARTGQWQAERSNTEATGPSISEVTQQNSILPQYQQGGMHNTASTSMDQKSAPYYSLSQVQAAVHQQSIKSHRQLGGDFMFTSGQSERHVGVGVNLPNSIIGQILPSEQHSNNAGATKNMCQRIANLENHVNSRQVLLNKFSQEASNVARGERSLLNGQTHQSISSTLMWQSIFSTLSDAQRKTNNKERTSCISPIIDDSGLGHMRCPHGDSTSRILEAKKNEETSRSYAVNDVSQLLSNGYLQSMALRQQQVLFEHQAHSIREESHIPSQTNQTDSHQQLVLVSPNIHANKQNTSLPAMMTPFPAKWQTNQSSRRTALQIATEKKGVLLLPINF